MTSPLTYEQKWGTPEGKDSVDLCSSLPRWLGDRLINLGKYTTSVPGPYLKKSKDFDTALKEWRFDLTSHGKALLTFATADDIDGTAKADENKVAYFAAQAALRWCADNLANLWD
jgi:hypothetical protein